MKLALIFLFVLSASHGCNWILPKKADAHAKDPGLYVKSDDGKFRLLSEVERNRALDPARFKEDACQKLAAYYSEAITRMIGEGKSCNCKIEDWAGPVLRCYGDGGGSQLTCGVEFHTPCPALHPQPKKTKKEQS